MSFADDLLEPPEEPQAQAADPRARLDAAAGALGDDEIRVLALVAERLAMGRRQYGPLELQTDGRAFHQEALEEAADGLVYTAAALIRSTTTEGKTP
ncbi:MAG: hypothetical protein ACOCXM_03225 [Myxococcota bacterium]